MRITTRGRYALRATIALAKMGREGVPISINNLSEQEEISSVFLEQIFFRLRKAGIVNSVRGPGGGFCFALPLEKLTIKEILDAAGEELCLAPCGKEPGECRRKAFCAAHPVWEEANGLVNDYLRNLTLSQILEKTAVL